MNHGGTPTVGRRIHESVEARASSVPVPGREELDQELTRIMAPRPRPGTEDPGSEPGRTRPRRELVRVLVGVTAVAGGAAALLAVQAAAHGQDRVQVLAISAAVTVAAFWRPVLKFGLAAIIVGFVAFAVATASYAIIHLHP